MTAPFRFVFSLCGVLQELRVNIGLVEGLRVACLGFVNRVYRNTS